MSSSSNTSSSASATIYTKYGRNREDVATLYDVFCELVAPKPGEKLARPKLQYPDDFHDPSTMKSVQQYAFPCQLKDVDVDAVQLFSFVLTDSNSKFSFGFCRYTPRNDTCICFLSGFFWPNIFYKALNDIALVLGSAQREDVKSVLTKFYYTDIPKVNEVLCFADHHQKYSIDFAETIPDPTRTPTLSSDKYFLEFYNAIDPRQMLAIFASLLKERRILFTGQKLGTLSSCLHAVSMLLFPMCWQSVLITILPESLVDMVKAPTPYLIGVPKNVLDKTKLNLNDIGEVVIVDIDERTITSPFDDVGEMPQEVANYLKTKLKKNEDTAIDDSFGMHFLRAMVLLFGTYKTGFVGEKSTFTFSKKRFVAKQRSDNRLWFSSLLGADGVLFLKRFVQERGKLINQGNLPVDQFEVEIELMDLPSRMKMAAVAFGVTTKETSHRLEVFVQYEHFDFYCRSCGDRMKLNGKDWKSLPMSGQYHANKKHGRDGSSTKNVCFVERLSDDVFSFHHNPRWRLRDGGGSTYSMPEEIPEEDTSEINDGPDLDAFDLSLVDPPINDGPEFDAFDMSLVHQPDLHDDIVTGETNDNVKQEIKEDVGDGWSYTGEHETVLYEYLQFRNNCHQFTIKVEEQLNVLVRSNMDFKLHCGGPAAFQALFIEKDDGRRMDFKASAPGNYIAQFYHLDTKLIVNILVQ